MWFRKKLIIAPATTLLTKHGLPRSIRLLWDAEMPLSALYAETPSWAGSSFSNNNDYVLRIRGLIVR